MTVREGLHVCAEVALLLAVAAVGVLLMAVL